MARMNDMASGRGVTSLLAGMIAIVVIAASSEALAQSAESRLPVNQQTTEQKALFLENLVSRSQSVRKIEEAGDAAALDALAKAQGLVDAAKADLGGGDFASANVKLNEALALVTEHTRRLSQDDITRRHDQRRYQALHGSVLALRDAYVRVAEEDTGEEARASTLQAIDDGLAEGERLADAVDLDGAIGVLRQAYDVATTAVSDLREGKTVVSSLNFETPEEEYDYEIDRHDSHRYLLTLALSENAPHPSFLEEIGRLRQQSDDLRAKAEAQAAGGNFEAGIRTLDQATGQLINAIRMAGIYIP